MEEEQVLTIEHYQSVLEVLWEIRAEYNKIGIKFGLSPSDVKAVEKSNHYQVDECFMEVLSTIFHNKAISKEELVIVLESKIIDRKKLANVVRRTVFLTVEEILQKGHVPARQRSFIRREKTIESIRKELYKLKDKDGWVVVHGMGGFGKTVLAAEAIRDEEIIIDIFPGGVQWLTIGQLKNNKGKVDEDKLLSKLRTLIRRVDKINPQLISTVQEATDYLQEVILKQHSKFLLILNDVWNSEAIRAFAVQCSALITTRSTQVVQGIPKQQKSFISVSDGFSKSESKSLLSLRLAVNHEDLLPYADTVIDYCRGSPLAIALIGAIVQSNTESRWKAVINNLKKASHTLDAPIALDDESFQYNTLASSIELSIQSLPEGLRNYFELLVVLKHDMEISPDVLETVWDMDNYDTEDCLTQLVDYSLVQQVNPVSLHDLIIDYLKAKIPEEKQVEYHKQVVQHYTKKCQKAYSSLVDDGHIYHSLPFHISESGNFELLSDLLSDLKWLSSSVEYGAVYNLFSFYKKFDKEKVPKKFVPKVQAFQEFLTTHLDKFINELCWEDVVQFAIYLPDSNEVFQQALAIVKENKEKLWFTYNKQTAGTEKVDLKIKAHAGHLHHCQYSFDGTSLFTCGGQAVKMWNSSTGEELAEFKGHTGPVFCCALAYTSNMVVSGSKDKTVKVWNVDNEELVIDFTKHQNEVQCCSVSPDEKLVLSCDIGSNVLVWEMVTGKVLYHWKRGMLFLEEITNSDSFQPSNSSYSSESVISCTFDPSGEYFVVGHSNGKVRIWCLEDLSMISLDGHNEMVTCCTYAKSGDLLATGSHDYTTKVWDVSDIGEHTCKWILHHKSRLSSCSFSADGTRLLTTSDKYLRIWLLSEKDANGVLLNDVSHHNGVPIHSAFYSPDEQHIISGDWNGIVKIVKSSDIQKDSASSVERPQFAGDISVFFHDGNNPTILCFNFNDKQVQLLSGKKAEMCIPSLPVDPNHHLRCCREISNKGDKIVVGNGEGMIQLLQLNRNDSGQWLVKELWRIAAHRVWVRRCFFSPDDTRIVSQGSSDSQFKIWEANGGNCIAEIECASILPSYDICLVDCFMDNERFVFAQKRGVLLWSESMQTCLKYKGFCDADNYFVSCIHLSKNNSRLIASVTSGKVAVWDTTSKSLLMKLCIEVKKGSSGAVPCTLSMDGTIAVAGMHGKLKIWNVEQGEQLASWDCGMIGIVGLTQIMFTPDEKQILTFQEDKIQWWKTNGTAMKKLILKKAKGIKVSPEMTTFVIVDSDHPYFAYGYLYVYTTL